MDQDLYLDEMEVALGSKIKDRRAFVTAFRGLMSCCEGGDDSGEDEDEDEDEGRNDAPAACHDAPAACHDAHAACHDAHAACHDARCAQVYGDGGVKGQGPPPRANGGPNGGTHPPLFVIVVISPAVLPPRGGGPQARPSGHGIENRCDQETVRVDPLVVDTSVVYPLVVDTSVVYPLFVDTRVDPSFDDTRVVDPHDAYDAYDNAFVYTTSASVLPEIGAIDDAPRLLDAGSRSRRL